MKPTLYVSQHCKYSKNAFVMIQKLKLDDKFSVVNIDSARGNLPHYLDRVPMLVLSPQQRYFDDALFDYIVELSRRIEDFGYATDFYFIDENHEKGTARTYDWLESGNQQAAPVNGGNGRQQIPGRSRTNGEVDNRFESLMQQRATEEARLFPSRKPSEAEVKAMFDKTFPPPIA